MQTETLSDTVIRSIALHSIVELSKALQELQSSVFSHAFRWLVFTTLFGSAVGREAEPGWSDCILKCNVRKPGFLRTLSQDIVTLPLFFTQTIYRCSLVVDSLVGFTVTFRCTVRFYETETAAISEPMLRKLHAMYAETVNKHLDELSISSMA